MLTAVLALILVTACESFPAYPQLSNHHQKFDSSEITNSKRMHQSNRIMHCDMNDFKHEIGLKELQQLVEAVASRKGLSPYIVLSKLLNRMRNMGGMEDAILNTLEGAALQELLNPEINHLPPPPGIMPPLPNRGPYAVPMMNNAPPYSIPLMNSAPPFSGPVMNNAPPYSVPAMNGIAPYSIPAMNNAALDNTPVYIVPVSQPAPGKNHNNRVPQMMKPEGNLRGGDNTPLFLVPVSPESRHEAPVLMNGIPGVEKMSHMLPAVFPMISSSRMLKPPLAATVRVNTGDPRNPVPDVSITVSPLMSLVEAIRQAEIKYQNTLGLSHDSDIFTFARSDTVNCFVINRFDEVQANGDLSWKVTVQDRDGQEVYEDFCLPDAKEVIVKPGTVVSLSYVPL